MDAVLFRLPVTVIITVVALAGAYKLGTCHAGKLSKAEGRVEGKVEGKAEGNAGGEDSDGSRDEEDSGSGDEVEEKPCKESKGAVTGRQKRKTAKTKPKGEKKGVMDDDWEWPVYSITKEGNRVLRPKQEKSEPNFVPFEITYRRKQHFRDAVKVKLRSTSLIQVARKCLPNHTHILVGEEPEINGRDLFSGLDSFKKSYQSMQNPEHDAVSDKYHLKHLIRFLETEYRNTIPHVERTRQLKTVRWDLLWTFLRKGEVVYYTCSMTGRKLQGIVWFVGYYALDENRRFCKVEVKCYDYNGTNYVQGMVKIDIAEFRVESEFKSIGICPFSLLEQSEVDQLEAMFLQNGKKFYNIVSRGSPPGSFYMQYEGPRLEMVLVERAFESEWELRKEKADGRVMVDLTSFARMNPGYPLNNAKPQTGKSLPDTDMPSDEDLMLAPAIVYGFSFSNKKWGAFDVGGLSKIDFKDQAFDRDLVLSDPLRKKMLLALVSEYLRTASVPQLDPISNKGEGCVLLCYGPPGTGKTLTAESIAERLHTPLWSISVFELGTTAQDLEKNLFQILGIAAHWRAVLLLDEADVYMEKRTSNGDPTRTAMTSIFLRLIEYYRGVLFLTTNRVTSFDDAFCSRISLFLRFHRLAGDQCKAVWYNLLTRAGIENPDVAPFMETSTQLNGREIRNTIRIAQTWAVGSGEKLTTGHVLQVVKMVGEFSEEMEGAIRDEYSDERSITRALDKVRSMKGRNSTAERNGN